MTLPRTFQALAVAAFGGATPYFAVELLAVKRITIDLSIAYLIFGGVALAAATVLVFPVLVFAPRLRTPSYVVAALWGAAVAIAASTVVSGAEWRLVGWRPLALFAVTGATSGVIYAATARAGARRSRSAGRSFDVEKERRTKN